MEKIKEFLMQAPAATAIFEGPDFNFILANPQCQELIGKSEEQLLGRSIREIFPSRTSSMLISYFHKVYEDKKPIHGSAVPIKMSSSGKSVFKYFDYLLQPINNEQNEFKGIIAHAVDVSEQVEAQKQMEEKEETLKKTKEQLELSIHAGKIGLWHWDVHTNLFSWNSEQLEIFGIPGTELKTSAEEFFNYIVPEDRQRMIDTFLLESRISGVEYTFRIQRKDGTFRDLRTRLKTFTDNAGKANYVTGIMVDITEQKIGEQKLKFAAALTESMADAVIATTTAEDGFRITAWNRGAEKIYGWKEEEVIGKSSQEVLRSNIHKEDIQKIFSSLSEGFWDGEVMQLHKDGRPIHIHASLALVKDENGKSIGIVGVNRDITEKKLAEKKIRDSEEKYKQLAATLEEKVNERTNELIFQMEELKKALAADQMKSDFIKMASHELKTPVTSIKGYIQLLLSFLSERSEKDLPPYLLRSTLGSVEKQVDRLTRLLSELLDLSRIESGQLNLNKEPFSLNELVIDTIQDMLHTRPEYDIHVFHEGECIINGDKDRINQVLVNLLSNAIKYSPENKRIDVTIGCNNNTAVVTVKDWGIGIEGSEQEKIFDRFYRAGGANEKTYPGFGIGLFIAREIIERHGGKIGVQSEKNKGATFRLELPV